MTMPIEEAAQVLRRHNEWLRGADDNHWQQAPYSPAELGHAIDTAVAALEAMGSPRVGPHLFTVSNGEAPAPYSLLRRVIREVADGMVEAGTAVSVFTPGDIRRTVETRLAALGVSSEVRAHLQSHGLTGVQIRHYNVHDYADEKRAALERLHRLVTGAKQSNVRELKARR